MDAYRGGNHVPAPPRHLSLELRSEEGSRSLPAAAHHPLRSLLLATLGASLSGKFTVIDRAQGELRETFVVFGVRVKGARLPLDDVVSVRLEKVRTTRALYILELEWGRDSMGGRAAGEPVRPEVAVAAAEVRGPAAEIPSQVIARLGAEVTSQEAEVPGWRAAAEVPGAAAEVSSPEAVSAASASRDTSSVRLGAEVVSPAGLQTRSAPHLEGAARAGERHAWVLASGPWKSQLLPMAKAIAGFLTVVFREEKL